MDGKLFCRFGVLGCVLLVGLWFGSALTNAQESDSEGEEAGSADPLARFDIDLGVSLRDQGTAAYNARDWSEAIVLYRQALVADPRDENTWYNLACTYALADNAEKAQWALDRAIAAGWEDHRHATRDPDLEILRESEAFKLALQAMERNASAMDMPDMQRQFVPMTSTGTYVALVPPGYNDPENAEKTYPLCLLLHGSGSTELAHGRMCSFGGRKDVIYICPRAPHPHVSVMTSSGNPGYTVWPPESTEGLEEITEPMVLYVNFIADCVEHAREHYRANPGKIFAIGHSQGAGACNALAVKHPTLLKSYFAYAGYFPEGIFDDAAYKTVADSGVHPVLVHCAEDNIVLPEESTKGAEKLQAAGGEYTLKVFETGGHSFTQDVRLMAREWAVKWFAKGVDE